MAGSYRGLVTFCAETKVQYRPLAGCGSWRRRQALRVFGYSRQGWSWQWKEGNLGLCSPNRFEGFPYEPQLRG